ncbi:MAG: hypothetical protein ACLRWQ_02355 [Flavonifractor plautii]
MFIDETEDAYCVWRADYARSRAASAPMVWTSSCRPGRRTRGAAGRKFIRRGAYDAGGAAPSAASAGRFPRTSDSTAS